MHWPTDHPGQDNIISLFGPRDWNGRPGFHYGTDFGADIGDRFLAVEEAVISDHFWGGNIGWVTYYLSIDGKRRWETHGGVEVLPQPLFTHVDEGGCVDFSGDSESRDVSTGPHLHLGLWDMERGEYIDPLPLIIGGGNMEWTQQDHDNIYGAIEELRGLIRDLTTWNHQRWQENVGEDNVDVKHEAAIADILKRLDGIGPLVPSTASTFTAEEVAALKKLAAIIK